MTLPAGTTFVSLTQTAGPSFTPTTPAVGSNGTVTLSATSLAAGASATFTLVIGVNQAFTGASLSNTATGTTSTTDTDPTNDAGTATTSVTPTATGTVYLDLNANGVRDAGDPGQPGQEVFLDSNGNGVLDTGEPLTTTDAAGGFVLVGAGQALQLLAPGEFALGSDGLGLRQSHSATVIPPFFPLFQGEPSPNEAFVRSVYRGVLGREGEAAGVAGWVALLQSGGTREQVAEGIWRSDEHRLQQIDRYYRDCRRARW